MTIDFHVFSLDSQDEETDVFVAKEQRRFAHSAAEQKRRDAIRVCCYCVYDCRDVVCVPSYTCDRHYLQDVQVFVHDHLQFTNCRISLHWDLKYWHHGKCFPISSFDFALCKHEKLSWKLQSLTFLYFIKFYHWWHFKLLFTVLLATNFMLIFVFFLPRPCTWK